MAQVLRRLGIDPGERFSELEPDAEYTACRVEELPRYLELYGHGDLAPEERSVLCCFLLEGLNDAIQLGRAHPLQPGIFDALLDHEELHRDELAYWSGASEPENRSPITAALVEHRTARERSLRPPRS